MVVGEPVDVVVERVDARRGDDPGLPHRAAEEVLRAPRLAPSAPSEPATIAPSGQPRPFERQSVTVSNVPPISAAGTPSATAAFSEPRAVEVHAQPELARGRRRTAASSSSGQIRPPDELCVFSSETSFVTRLVARARVGHRRADLLRREPSARSPGSGAREQPRVHGRAARSAMKTCECSSAITYVAGLGEDPERDLVRHRRRRQVDRRLLAEQLRGARLELDHRRVLALLLVADDRVRDRLAACPATAA